MAATYNNLQQAQALYDTVLKQKQRVQRNDHVRAQQAVKGIGNYLRQSGLGTTGASETAMLKARGQYSDVSAYDVQLAEIGAAIEAYRARQGRGGADYGSTRYDYTNTSASEAQKRAMARQRGSYVPYVPFPGSTGYDYTNTSASEAQKQAIARRRGSYVPFPGRG